MGLTNTNAISCFNFDVLKSNYTYFANRQLYYGAISGGKAVTIDGTTSPYYATYDDDLIICDMSFGPVDIYLPDTATIPINNQGGQIKIKKVGAVGQVRVWRQGTNTIDNIDHHDINGDMDSHIIQSDGTNYWIIGTK